MSRRARSSTRPAKTPKGGWRCVCGCGRRRGVQLHHVVYRQELRHHVPRPELGPPDIIAEERLMKDPRNLVPVGPNCHAAHHNRSRPLRLAWLPDSVFEFAGELLGPGAAYEYLRRRYDGGDERLDALLEVAEAA